MKGIIKKSLSIFIAVTIAMSSLTSNIIAEDLEISPHSLFPLETVNITVDMHEFTPDELKALPKETFIEKLNNNNEGIENVFVAGNESVWVKYHYSSIDEFDLLDDTIDLSPYYSFPGYNYFNLHMIVGSADQLDPDNKRYIVRVNYDPIPYNYNFDVFAQEKSESEENNNAYYHAGYESVYYNDYNYTNSYGFSGSVGYVDIKKQYWSAEYDLKLLMELDFDAEVTIGYNVYAYKGFFDSLADAKTASVNDAGIDMSNLLGVNGYSIEDYTLPLELTVILTKGEGESEKTALIKKIRLVLREGVSNVETNWIYTYDDKYGYFNDIARSSDYSFSNGVETVTYTLMSGYDSNAEYYTYFNYYDGGSQTYDETKVDKAVVGLFDSIEDAVDQADIKDELFDYNKGYKANFSGEGVNFTVFAEGLVYKFCIKVNLNEVGEDEIISIPNPGSRDTTFEITGVVDAQSYIMPYKHDTYYAYGYQTLFINDDEFDLTSVKPVFRQGTNVNIYQDGEIQKSSTDVKNFSAGTLQYSASSESGDNSKQYWVNVLKKEENASLFVNGPDKREIFFDSVYGYYHDVFLANVGAEALTGLKVELLDAENIKLDDYWTIKENTHNTLEPFTTTITINETHFNLLHNIAKIRLLPDGEGIIKGTLKITSDNGGSREIELTGIAGDPKIAIDSVKEGVKFIPYSTFIPTTNMYEWNKETFSLIGGKLPEGIELRPNGEIYGVTKETGEFTFKVQVSFSGFQSDSRYIYFPSVMQEFTLKINENTNEFIEASNAPDYTIETRIPNISSYSDKNLKIENEEETSFNDFKKVWIDGVELEEDTDYTKKEGSTIITIRSQTFKKFGTGNHTIATEFRVGGNDNNEMKSVAQNFTISIRSGSSSGGGGGGSGSVVTTASPTVAIDAKISEIVAAASKNDGSVVEIDMGASTSISRSTLEVIKGKNITLKLNFGTYSCAINGQDVTDSSKDINLSVKKADASANPIVDIPKSAIESCKVPVVQVKIGDSINNISGTVSLSLGTAHSSLRAVLCNYNQASSSFEMVSSGIIDSDGKVILKYESTGNYAILIVQTGDVTLDGAVTPADATAVLKHISQIITLSSMEQYVASSRGDNKVTVSDVTTILKYVIELSKII